MKIYLVGGAVRDELLGLPVSERDYVVVGATEAQLLERGFRRLDVTFPVFLHPRTGAEYALARRERKTGPGYKGFEVDAGPDVTLEQDLARRDLTINALARDPDGKIIDLFHGRDDLDAGMLRHITPAFEEDPVRLLRVARFAAKLGRWGFRTAHATQALMRRMAAREEVVTVLPERLREEMQKALTCEQPWRFFEVLHACGALARLLPVLASAMGERPAPHDRRSAPPMQALRRACALSTDRAVRFAALFAGLTDPRALPSQRLLPDREARSLLGWVERWPAEQVAKASASELLTLLETLKLQHQPERLQHLAAVWAAGQPHQAAAAEQRLRLALRAAAGVQAADLLALGLRGPEIGQALRAQRRLAIERLCE